MNKFRKIAVGALLALGVSSAQALPIVGSLDMGGGAYALDASGAIITDASQAVAIDFQPNNFYVLAADGDFAGLLWQQGDIQDFAFDPFSGPISAFWTVGGFSFELTNVVRGTTNSPGSFLVLNGTGTISAVGFDDTATTWSFTGDTTGNGSFSWNATSDAVSTPVPEPGTLALLTLGVIGLALRKRIKI